MTPQLLCRQAYAFYQQGRSTEAFALISQALAADPGNVQALALKGVLLQTNGRIKEALRIYDQILAKAPDPELWNNRGAALQSLKRLDEALSSFDAALALQPAHAGALYNRATVLMELDRNDEALAGFNRAVALMPDYAEARNNRGAVLQKLYRSSEALADFNTALSLMPDYPEALYNRGMVLEELGRWDAALASFDKALALRPGDAQAWNKRGIVLQRLKRFDEALASFARALSLQPDHAEALKNTGSALCESDRVAEGFAAFTRHAEQLFGMSRRAVSGELPHKARHDREQQAYIKETTGKDVDIAGALHRADGGRLAARTISSHSGDIAERWRTAQPQIVVIDNFLTPEALEKLRRFCLGSTVWRKVYAGGYLGALPEYGFASPLLAQVADDLRDAYPAIFAGHPLHYAWGFKYDSAHSGIALHADKAAVNVNFWLTPDDSNLDPGGGGLVIWDVAAPQDWDFRQYNGDTEASRDFLRRSGAKSVTVPYRANRAVIFDSDLFHETDKIAFKEGYLNRRINVTLLYGRRTSDNR